MKMDKKTKEEWDNLYEYIRKDIFNIMGYDEKKALPKNLVLRLKGLCDGKFMANSNTKAKAIYTFPEILLTFKICKFDIQSALKNNNFNNESHMVNYIMIIIENKINDVVSMIERKKKSEEKTEKLDLVNQIVDKAEYQPKTKEVKNERLKELW